MATTTKYGVNTPDDSTPNDFAGWMQTLADGVTDNMAGYAEGTFAARPAATSANKGLFYRATDNTVNGGWFCSDGSTWVRFTPSPFVTWTPGVTLDDGSGAGAPSGMAQSLTSTTYLYRILPGNQAQIYMEATVALSTVSTQSYAGLVFTSPVASARKSDLHADIIGDTARAWVGDYSPYGNCIAAFPQMGYNAKAWQSNNSVQIGRWPVPTVGGTLRINGTYPI